MSDNQSYSVGPVGGGTDTLINEFGRRLQKLLIGQEPGQDIGAAAKIRGQKILELCQTAILTFWVGLGLGMFIDGLFPEYDEEESTATTSLWAMLQLCFVAIGVFMLGKIVALFPFFFHFSRSYQPGRGKTINLAKGVATAIVFVSTQSNFISRVKAIQSHARGKVGIRK